MKVTKRDGTREDLNIDKLHKVVMYAVEGLTGVSASQVEINSQIQFYDGIASTDIQETLIKSTADLITEETPNYQYVAGRLINYHLRKMVYDTFEPPCLCDIVQKNIDDGFYDPEFVELYTKEEINQLQINDKIIVFIMRPIPMKDFVKTVQSGEVLPPKVTNFLPKPPAGLVFQSLEGEL